MEIQTDEARSTPDKMKIIHPNGCVFIFKSHDTRKLNLNGVDSPFEKLVLEDDFFGTLNSESTSNNAVCITLYNESLKVLTTSLTSVIRSIKYYATRSKKALNSFSIVIVSDGWDSLDPKTYELFSHIGLISNPAFQYDSRVEIRGKTFSCDSLLNLLNDNSNYITNDNNLPPKFSVNVIFCVKKDNEGKLDSHWWFYNIVCPKLMPNICFQLDTGTKVAIDAIGDIHDKFSGDTSIGAVASRIEALPGSVNGSLLYLWQYAMFRETAIRSWPSELFFFHLSVIPGQFSAIRYNAFTQKDSHSQYSPIDIYFRGLDECTLFEKTLFLAEDRVIAYSLNFCSQQNSKVSFSDSVVAYTDTCNNWKELLLQRRRWHLSYISSRVKLISLLGSKKQNNKANRKLTVAAIYHSFKLAFDWFIPFLYLTSMFTLSNISYGYVQKIDDIGVFVFSGALLVLTLSLCFQLYAFYQNRLSNFNIAIIVCSIYYQTILMVMMATYITISGAFNGSISTIFFLIVVLTSYPLLLLVGRKGDYKNQMTIHFFVAFFRPAIAFALWCYAIFNCHDFSWGTKGLTQKSSFYHMTKDHPNDRKIKQTIRIFRLKYIAAWGLSNTAAFMFFYHFLSYNSIQILKVILVMISIYILIETFGASMKVIRKP